MVYGYLADAVVVLHLGYILFCILATLLVVAGVFLGWKWIRNPIFRWTHALMIIVVAFEASIGFECPLTTWEWDLREMQRNYETTRVATTTIGMGSTNGCVPLTMSVSLYPGQIDGPRPFDYIGRFAHDTLFVDWPMSVLMTAYFSFATIVVLCFIIAPPRWRKRSQSVLREPVEVTS